MKLKKFPIETDFTIRIRMTITDLCRLYLLEIWYLFQLTGTEPIRMDRIQE